MLIFATAALESRLVRAILGGIIGHPEHFIGAVQAERPEEARAELPHPLQLATTTVAAEDEIDLLPTPRGRFVSNRTLHGVMIAPATEQIVVDISDEPLTVGSRRRVVAHDEIGQRHVLSEHDRAGHRVDQFRTRQVLKHPEDISERNIPGRDESKQFKSAC